MTTSDGGGGPPDHPRRSHPARHADSPGAGVPVPRGAGQHPRTRYAPPARSRQPGGRGGRTAQQLVNGLTLGSLYGLIAIGYTVVYGIVQLINFAHGEIFMIGAFGALSTWLIFFDGNTGAAGCCRS